MPVQISLYLFMHVYICDVVGNLYISILNIANAFTYFITYLSSGLQKFLYYLGYYIMQGVFMLSFLV